MKLGVSGTRHGLTPAAAVAFTNYMDTHTVDELHHGDCLGVDKTIHDLVTADYDAQIIIHPPDNETLRAFCKSETIHTPKPYIVRNKRIVNSVDRLIAFPPTKEEIVRSGTWATIRYAKKKKLPTLLIFKDGSTL